MTQHPNYVAGWHGSLDDLAKTVGRMRYDRIADFMEALEAELMDQANVDREAGRKRLARKLYAFCGRLNGMQAGMRDIWKLCAPREKPVQHRKAA